MHSQAGATVVVVIVAVVCYSCCCRHRRRRHRRFDDRRTCTSIAHLLYTYQHSNVYAFDLAMWS